MCWNVTRTLARWWNFKHVANYRMVVRFSTILNGAILILYWYFYLLVNIQYSRSHY